MHTSRILAHATRLAVFAILLACAAFPARAQLLTSAYETQLENWLGQGTITFTNIFTKIAGDGQDSYDFHAAADNQGPTFVLMEVGTFGTSGDYVLPAQTIGGYDPLSWDSAIGFYNLSSTDAQRTAFIFNLTYNAVQSQNLIGQGYVNSGSHQTYNAPSFGPTFGTGDIATFAQLESGQARNYCYGGTSDVQSITLFGSGVTNSLPNTDWFSISRLEVYTFTAAPDLPPGDAGAVPEPSTYGLIAAATLLALIALRRRLRSATA